MLQNLVRLVRLRRSGCRELAVGDLEGGVLKCTTSGVDTNFSGVVSQVRKGKARQIIGKYFTNHLFLTVSS
jgi:hypothetical protein